MVLTLGALTVLAGCSKPASVPAVQVPPAVTTPAPTTPAPTQTPPPQTTTPPATNPATGTNTAPATKPTTGTKAPTGEVVPNPNDISVVVNKHYMLPDGYRPADLVEPNVKFIFQEKDEKRLMRKEAAQALEQMFAAAQKDGIHLAGVSGFRSFETQTSLFNYYVNTQGEETARMYSAEPGHSEHQTGLAMDVSGSTGKCAADDCFANEPEAPWLAAHAADYGFIVRYPKGKESITGYAYEPWHMRYVGVTMAKQIAAKGVTLEEFLGKTAQ
jgi:D-alanyl-D-alanine carboxypeptidase